MNVKTSPLMSWLQRASKSKKASNSSKDKKAASDNTRKQHTVTGSKQSTKQSKISSTARSSTWDPNAVRGGNLGGYFAHNVVDDSGGDPTRRPTSAPSQRRRVVDLAELSGGEPNDNRHDATSRSMAPPRKIFDLADMQGLCDAYESGGRPRSLTSPN